MKVYNVVKNGIITNSWTDKNGMDETYWEPCFGEKGSYSIEVEEIIPSYVELRKKQYELRIDPLLSEAITDKEAGNNSAMEALLSEKALIKSEIPKPSNTKGQSKKSKGH